jgi:ribosomal protein S18 acetylase RimI-like enzyme
MTSYTSDAPLRLRPATAEDAEEIARIWHNGWRDGHHGHTPESLHEHRRLPDFLKRVPPRLAATTVATLGSRIVGFVMLCDDEVEQIYVDAFARGGPTASALLRHGETTIATRFDAAWLAVAVGNARARRFYERNGWRDARGMNYPAEAGSGTILVPCRRYEKELRG